MSHTPLTELTLPYMPDAVATAIGWAHPQTGEQLVSMRGLENPVPYYRPNSREKAFIDPAGPKLTAVASSAVTTTGFTLTATSDLAATGYILVVTGTDAPSVLQVEAGVSYGNATAVSASNAAMLAATPKAFAVTGLTANTTYRAHLVAKTASGKYSIVSTTVVTTAAA